LGLRITKEVTLTRDPALGISSRDLPAPIPPVLADDHPLDTDPPLGTSESALPVPLIVSLHDQRNHVDVTIANPAAPSYRTLFNSSMVKIIIIKVPQECIPFPHHGECKGTTHAGFVDDPLLYLKKH